MSGGGRRPIAPTSYQMLLEDGRPMSVFLDQVVGQWYWLKGTI